MGAIKSSKLDNGMIGLEITYGGKDSPFGGVDYSAPPTYIDPNCFADASGFLVIDGQLVAFGWFPVNITLEGWTSSMTYMDSGHSFMNGQYYNWTLAYTSSTTPPSGSNPGFTDSNFTIWTWLTLNPGAVPITATLTVRQVPVTIPATSATAAIDITGNTAVGTGVVWVQFYNDIGQIYPIPIHTGDTIDTIATNITNYLNTTGASGTVHAAATGNRVILTSVQTGPVANTIPLTVTSFNTGTSTGYIPVATVTQAFSGALPAITNAFSQAPNPVSWVNVGETLYIGGYGTMILSFSLAGGTPVFSLLTSYLGAVCLGKFNSQLIAAGVVPGPGTVIQQPEMVLAWSAPNKFGIWNPTNSDGTVTGAGFNQISDISDYLSGIFLTPGTAVIMRAQGIDYITPLSGGFSPFDFVHISNALMGEGCQHFKWVTEYDQVGFFAGNSDIYMFSGSISPIGAKIKNAFFSRSVPVTYRNHDSAAGQFNFLNANQVLTIFIEDNMLFIYNLTEKNWMPYSLATAGINIFDIEWLARDVLPAGNPQWWIGFNAVLVLEDALGQLPQYFQMLPYVQDLAFSHATQCHVSFPQEEISFGRDITIESCYISIAGIPGQEVNFDVSGVLQAQLILPPSASTTVFDHYQVWFTQGADDKATVQKPQLSITLPLFNPGVNASFRISKIALFGSFDPAQRPV